LREHLIGIVTLAQHQVRTVVPDVDDGLDMRDTATHEHLLEDGDRAVTTSRHGPREPPVLRQPDEVEHGRYSSMFSLAVHVRPRFVGTL
jgi:hypothetical protein